ncbi:MAG: aminotransferase class III-fold pyridoxal phosphate-dependent enzyme [Deltaproteobacteria bacterium]|nr:MAG: aminotransferase class III-fold pyridoxal phosphate-dependent enzyme [Deltaproteobacteria bacterium]
MGRSKRNPLRSLADAPGVREAAQALIEAVRAASGERELSAKAYERALRDVARLRGRPLAVPALVAPSGRGARVRLADGRTLLDFVCGIGTYLFGHSDPDLLETAAIAAVGDSVFQGHLAPAAEYPELLRALLRHAGPHIKHGWLSISGAIANENAMKLVLQKHAPADMIVAFERNFAGRTLALAEITDKAAYREGLPLSGRVLYVPFHDPDRPQRTVEVLDAHLKRYPGRIAGMIFELVQGEGGYHTAPPAFFRAVMECCRAAGLAVWVDEVQTFARTGELFAYRTFGLEDLVDVVTCGKALQGSAALFRARYNPKPGLIAGTYAGSTVGLAVGARILERLESEGYLGGAGRIAVLGERVIRRFDALRKRMPRAVGEHSGIGAMHAFVPFDGSSEAVQAIVEASFEEGLFVWSAGASPAKIRMLLPVNTTDEELESGFTMLEKALRRVAEARGLSC